MNLYQKLNQFNAHPISHAVMLSLLEDYSRPNDKIHEMLMQNILIPLKKGLYLNASSWENGSTQPLLVANHLLGPSYASATFMLSHYGLIPERVYEITSMTPKSSRQFKNSLGIFSYRKLPLPYYTLGIKQLKLSETHFAMVATAEKALCDFIITTKGLNFRSVKEIHQFLLDDLRIGTFELKSLNTEMITSFLPYTPKKQSLTFLIKGLKSL